MILFSNDFKRFPNAIIDYQTTNKSFLDIAALYAKMGVKNNVFMLVLFQPELQGIDPHSPDLTLEQKMMIGTECIYNPFYFMREVSRVPAVAGPVPVKFKANRGNIALLWSFFCNIDIALIQPRQTGKSVSTDCLMIYLLYIACQNTTINLITKDDQLRLANIERLKVMRDLIPTYLMAISSADSNNQKGLTCKAKDNEYCTGVAQNTESAANNLGRGITSPINHVDEGPFINHIGTTMPALLASGTAAREEAEQYGRPYGNIFTTTAGKKDDRDGRYMYLLISGGATWNEIAFLDAKDKKDLYNRVEKACSGRKVMINATFSHKQLGYTDEWLYKAMSNADSHGEKADRDFLNVWTSGTQRSPLSTNINDIIRRGECEVRHNEISKDGYIVRWYIPEDQIAERMANGKFILGLDTSDAISRDSVAGVLTATDDLSVIAAFTANETNLVVLSAFVSDFLVKYENVILIPERKSSAQTFIDSILLRLPPLGIDPFKRVFNLIVDDHTTRAEEYREILVDAGRRNTNFYDMRKRHFGFVTDGGKRNLLYSTVLQNSAKKAGHLIKDKVIIEELLGLVEKNGRIDHNTSGHDDFVIAWLLTHWFLTYGKNLQFYGIDPSRIENIRSKAGVDSTPIEDLMWQEQESIRNEIEETYLKLEKSPSEFEIAKLEHRIRFLSTKIIDSTEEVFSVDGLIQQAAENRKTIRRSAAKRVDNIDKDRMWDNIGGAGGYHRQSPMVSYNW